MKIDYEAVKDTPFGQFLGCAVGSEPKRIPEYNMNELDFSLRLDKKELNFQKVFSAFDRAVRDEVTRLVEEKVSQIKADLEKAHEGRVEAAPLADAAAILDKLGSVREAAQSAQSANYNRFGDAVASACGTAARITSDYARDAVNDACWEHGPPSDLNHAVIKEINGLISALERSGQ